MSEDMTRKTLWTKFQQHDQKILMLAGLAFLLGAIGLTLREIDLGMAYALAIGATLLMALSLGSRIAAIRMGGFGGSLLGAATAIIAYAVNFQDPNPAYLLTPLILLFASMIWVFRLERMDVGKQKTRADLAFYRLAWIGLTLALIVVSWSAYYHFISSGLSPEFHLRRLLLTGFWVACGVAFYVAGRVKAHPLMPSAGFVFISLALLKALLYDTSHLEGFDRIAAFAAIGLVLTGTSLFLKKRFPRRTPPPSPELVDNQPVTE